MTNKIIDLHLHSPASDGTLTPSQLADYAKEHGISAAALTDHDTVDGVEEFLEECNKIGIEGVPGVEISADYEPQMHVLGLFVDYKNKQLLNMLERLRKARYERNVKMLELLNKNGFDISEDEVISQKEDGTLYNTGRVHIAKVMEAKGYVPRASFAFRDYIGNGKPFYVPRFKLSPDMCAGMIQFAGGLAILAHPFAITHKKRVLDELLGQVKEWGFDGTEAYHSSHSITFYERSMELAPKHHLLITGGSDFHGSNKPKVEIGIVNKGAMTVPYSVYERLLEYRQRGY